MMLQNKTEPFIGIGIKPIDTTCSCGRSIRMWHNGSWHSADCVCGRNVRKKGAMLIIEMKPKTVTGDNRP